MEKNRNVVIVVSLGLIVLSVVFFSFGSKTLNRDQIWFTNMDQDSTLLIDSLRVNANREPLFIEHPSLSVYLLYGNGLRLLKILGQTKVANFDELFALEDPLVELPNLFENMRTLSLVFLILTALIVGFSFYLASGNIFASAAATSILLGTGGFLLQSLMVRTEGTSILFVALSILMLAGLIHTRINFLASTTLLIFAGVFLELGVFSKVVVLPLLAPALLFLCWWCMTQTNQRPEKETPAGQKIFVWLLGGAILAGIGYYFGTWVGREALLETKLPIIIVSLACLWVVQGCTLAWGKKLFFWIHPPLTFFYGVLVAGPFIYFYCHMETLYAKKYVANVVYSTGMARNSGYTTTLNHGASALMRELALFGQYSFFRTGILLATLLAIALSSRPGRLAGLLFMTCGIGMCLVMSLRYYGLHYLIYPDFFFSLALMSAATSPDRTYGVVKRCFASPRLFIGILIGLILIFSYLNFQVIKNDYPQYNPIFRDRIGYVVNGVSAAPEYMTRMLEKYGTSAAILRRVLSDPRLNGEEQGIDLLTRPQVRGDLEREGILDLLR